MKSKNIYFESKECDIYIKRALLKAQKQMEDFKINDKIVSLEKIEEKLNSFLEIYIGLSGVFYAIITITAVVLALIFPPEFMCVAISTALGLLWLFLYVLAICLLNMGFVFGLFPLLNISATSFVCWRSREIADEIIRWTQNKSNYNFKRLKREDKKYCSYYGYWQDSVFEAGENFYMDARTVLSQIHNGVTQEKVNDVAMKMIAEASEKKDVNLLIIACYLSECKFEILKMKLLTQ